ncbi:MAG: hypothetical protein RIC06_21690 [Cyclobacteriaceae bacterium]
MDIQTLKIELIQWLTEINDPEIIQQLTEIKEGHDWWDSITAEEQIAIDQGLKELDGGNSISHEVVKNAVQEKLKKYGKSN